MLVQTPRMVTCGAGPCAGETSSGASVLEGIGGRNKEAPDTETWAFRIDQGLKGSVTIEVLRWLNPGIDLAFHALKPMLNFISQYVALVLCALPFVQVKRTLCLPFGQLIFECFQTFLLEIHAPAPLDQQSFFGQWKGATVRRVWLHSERPDIALTSEQGWCQIWSPEFFLVFQGS